MTLRLRTLKRLQGEGKVTKRAEKKAKLEKQKLSEVRNQVNAVKPGAMKDIKVLGKSGNGEENG